MLKYLLKRLGMGVLTLFALTTITFFLMHIIPGSPFAGEMDKLPASVKEIMMKKYLLDQPIIVQFGAYLKNILRGDFGTSLVRKGTNVLDIITLGLPYTAKVGASAFCTAMVFGILLGVVAAFSKSGFVQGLAAIIATVGVSVPSFLMALGLMWLFGVKLKVLPLIGLTSWKHFIMPSVALALHPIAMISRLVRSSLTEELRQDYMILAVSKGTSRVKAIKNAIIPVITYAGPLLASLLTGSFVIETMFSIPGMGSEFVKSVTNRDYTLIMALTIMYGSMIIVANILTDLVTAMVDPRIRLS